MSEKPEAVMTTQGAQTKSRPKAALSNDTEQWLRRKHHALAMAVLRDGVLARWHSGTDFRVERKQKIRNLLNVGPLQLTTDDHLAGSVNAVNLENRFGNVETDCRYRLHS
jgi:hypothetical protein